MMNRYCIKLFTLILLQSCNSNENKVYDEHLKAEGVVGSYSKNYYDNGNLKHEVFYTDSVKNGEERWFYENGNVKSIKNYNMGVLYGDIFAYHKNGHIARYGFLDTKENLRFKVVYDSLSNLPDSIVGKSIYMSYNLKKISIGDTLSVTFYSARVPFTKTVLSYKVLCNEDIANEDTIIISDSMPVLDLNLLRKGEYDIIASVSHIFNDSSITTIKDTAFYHFEVHN